MSPSSPRPPSPTAPPAASPDITHLTAASSAAALLDVLHTTVRDADALRRDLAAAERRAAKAERLLAALHSVAAPNGAAPSPPNGADPPASPPHLPDSTVKALLQCEARADRAERAREDAELRLQTLLAQWTELDRYLGVVELRAADARAAFTRLTGSGPSSTSPHAPPHSNGAGLVLAPIPLPSHVAAGQHAFPPMHTRGGPLHHQAHGHAYRAPPFQALPLPPPPSASAASSTAAPAQQPHGAPRRPHKHARPDEWDTANKRSRLAYGASPTPDPARQREPERERDERARFSESPAHSPHLAHARTHSAASTRPAHASPSFTHLAPPHHHHPHPHSHGAYPSDRDRDRVLAGGAPPHALPPITNGTHPHPHSNGYGAPLHPQAPGYAYEAARARRYARARSSSRSSASSLSIDEMLLAAADHERVPEREREHRAAAYAKERATVAQVLDAGSAVRSEVGPHKEPPSLQTYQTHIFAPPVMGAPLKKSKSVPASQLVTLGPGGVILSGGGAATALPPSALPGGGFPAANAAGQRICRQCGMAGRYKDGKCVEKWGPGPEGPGTVCDRCRKKMKRVERRGTLDAQALQPHHGGGLHMHLTHPAPLPQRQDTLLVAHSRLPARAYAYSTEPDLDVDSRSGSGSHSSSSHGPSPQAGGAPLRRALTPPYITSISTREQYASGSAASSGDEDGEGDLDLDAEIARTLPRRGSHSGSGTHSPASAGTRSPKARLLNGFAPHENGVKAGSVQASPRSDVYLHYDTAGPRAAVRVNGSAKKGTFDDARMDADMDPSTDAVADADAEIMDAVNAASGNHYGTNGGRMKEEEL